MVPASRACGGRLAAGLAAGRRGEYGSPRLYRKLPGPPSCQRRALSCGPPSLRREILKQLAFASVDHAADVERAVIASLGFVLDPAPSGLVSVAVDERRD